MSSSTTKTIGLACETDVTMLVSFLNEVVPSALLSPLERHYPPVTGEGSNGGVSYGT
jgi:hypothetical protein